MNRVLSTFSWATIGILFLLSLLVLIVAEEDVVGSLLLVFNTISFFCLILITVLSNKRAKPPILYAGFVVTSIFLFLGYIYGVNW